MGFGSSIVGQALGAGAAIFGGVAASKAMKKAKEGVEAQRQKNENWFNRRYNEDATQRADAQAMLTKTQELLHERNKELAGSAAVAGGTEESIAASKAAANKALADTTSQIAVQGDAKKDRIETTYLNNDNAYQQQLNDLEVKRGQAIADAAQQVGKLGTEMAGMDFSKGF